MLFGYFTLLVALIIETVGAFYSVTGLAAIFSGAVIPIIIMGGALEIGKVTAAVWLKMNWERASVAYKLYLVPAVAILMFLTSMGIFGFLSKAHSDQTLVSGDVQAKIAIYDQKIQTAQENIEASRRTLAQMDAQVNEVLSRSNNTNGAERAVQIRRQQAKEREKLQNEITRAQTDIAKLTQESAPIRAEIRKVENEVGPIKYIAKMIYGDNPDANLLEKAVSWVIIIIVAVFDPLALVLILAAQQSIRWNREEQEKKLLAEHDAQPIEQPTPNDVAEPAELTLLDIEQQENQDEEKLKQFFWRARMVAKGLDADEEHRLITEANDLLSGMDPEEPDYDAVIEEIRAIRQSEESERQEKNSLQQALDALVEEYDRLTAEKQQSSTVLTDLETKMNTAETELQNAVARATQLQQQWDRDRSHMTSVEVERNNLQIANGELSTKNQDIEQQLTTTQNEVVKLQGWVDQLQSDLREAIALASERNAKLNEFMSKNIEVIELPQAIEEKQTNDGTVLDSDPNLGYEQKFFHKVTADNEDMPDSGHADFGTKFPTNPARGDMYLRVDFLPPVLYKWNGAKWIEIDRKLTDRLAYNQAYIEHLVAKIRSGEYDIDDLNDVERAEVAAYLNGNGTVQ
jgi:hypothetical protein